MWNNHPPPSNESPAARFPAVYEIRVAGRLDAAHWEQVFEGMELMTTSDGETVLVGHFPDQAALYGLLAKLRDLALPLAAVNVRA
jgi:hypothetical protein